MKFIGRSRRNRGRSQRGGVRAGPLADAGGSRRNRGRSQRGGIGEGAWPGTTDGGSRRNRGRSQRGGIVGYQI